MSAVALKSEYRPTLGEVLAPRWRRASRRARGVAVVAALVVVAAFAGAVARLEHPTLTYAGAVSFSFHYGGLYRVAPEAGGYARVQRARGDELEDSFGVAPLRLRPYAGTPSAALALYATGYIEGLARRYRDFSLRGEGWTQVDSISRYAVYNVFFTARVAGREMYGRDVLLLPERAGARRGVAIAMLSAVAGDRQVTSPLLLGTKGALEGPLTSFALG
ncbi:MAG TPA: hypothetical protein VK756_04185 [Solirubrobacteraceae bacterium]|nr:hypothetical protein [Solirubrobacteraceae bacterium]